MRDVRKASDPGAGTAAFVCLQCGRRAVVPHAGGFRCRECGADEPFNPIVGVGRVPLRVAYADPPYPGCASIYRDHPDFAGEVDHAELVAYLEREFPDGWALSTSASALPLVLSLCPMIERVAEFRVCSWVRSVVPRPPQRITWSWEPVIVRTPHWRQRHESDFVRDTLTSAGQPSGFLGGTITGQKPVAFCHWIFNLLGLGPDDELVDVFPGSGAVGRAWSAWRNQMRLAV